MPHCKFENKDCSFNFASNNHRQISMQDHFRKSRKPSYTNVFHDRDGVVGVVEFDTREDLKTAIADLDGVFVTLVCR